MHYAQGVAFGAGKTYLPASRGSAFRAVNAVHVDGPNFGLLGEIEGPNTKVNEPFGVTFGPR